MKKSLILILLLVSFLTKAQDFIWYNTIGGTGDIFPFKSVVDNNSNVYVLGQFSGNIKKDLTSVDSKGDIDIFISKFKANGNLEWIKSIGSSLHDFQGGLTLSEDGSQITVIGNFQGDCEVEGSFIQSSGSYDVLRSTFSSHGNLVSKQKILWGNDEQIVQDIVRFGSDLYLVGNYNDSINYSGGFQKTNIPKTGFIAKTDLDGNVKWLKSIYGKSSANRIRSCAAYQDGVYIAGYFQDSIFFDIDTLVTQNAKNDMYLYKLTTGGSGQWVKHNKGNGDDGYLSISCDRQGNVYPSGYFSSTDLKVDSLNGIYSIKANYATTNNDLFFSKYNSDGQLQWYNIGGSGASDRLYRSISTENTFVVGGQFSGSFNFNNKSFLNKGGADILALIYDRNDNLIYAPTLGGTGNDVCETAIIDNQDNFFLINDYTSTNLMINGSTISNDGGRDLLIVKYDKGSLKKTIDEITCTGSATGKIYLTPEGTVVPPFTFQWTKKEGGFTSDQQNIENLTAGTYRITFTDAVGYQKKDSVILTDPTPLTASENMTSHKNAVCYGSADGALALTVSGGTGTKSYVWSGNGTGVIANNVSQNAISAGTYSATVTDKKGCSVTVNNMVVTEPPKIHFKGTSVTPINGASGKVNLVVNGAVIPFTAAWTGAGTFTQVNEDIEGISVAGNYSVLVTDNNNCKADTTVLIVDSNNLYAFVSEKKNVSCKGGNDGSITVTPQTDNTNPSFSYAWTGPAGPYPNQPTITGVAGTYAVTITDNNAIPVETYTISDIIITEPAAALAATITGGNVTCFGLNNGYADANGTGGTLPYTYQWKKNGESLTEVAEVITSLGVGNYDVTITDALNCTATASTTLTPPPPITVNDAVVTPVTCNGTKNDGAIALNVSGGTGTLTYRWSNGLTGQNISLLSAGTYRCTITDINNCSTVTGQTVGQPSVITASFTNTNVSCYAGSNGAIDLTPAGGNAGVYTFKWNNNQVTEDISGLSVGSYSVTVVDSKKCEKSFTTSLTQPLAALDVTAAAVTNANCNGSATGSITLNTTGGTSPYLWSWSNNQTGSAVSNLVAGSYTVTVTDSRNCTKDASFTVAEPTALAISEIIASHTNVLCNGAGTGALEISASGSTGTYEYSLSGASWQTSPVFSNLASGDYNVMVRDQSVTSCQKTITAPVVITQPAAIAFTSPSATNITCNGLANGTISTAATGGTGSLLYKLILDGTETSNVSGASTGLFTGLASGANYTVEVADANNCKLTSNTFSISEPQAITLASAAATDITCPGLTNGAVNAQASGGTGALVYKLLLNDAETGNISGASSGSFADLSEGTTYKVQVTDANNCGPVSSQVLSVAAPQPVSLSNLTANNITCAGLTNGSISIQASGGNGSYSYKLLLNNTPGTNVTGATTGNFTGLSAGTGYSIEATDGNNCGPVVSNAVNIQEPAQISIVSQTASRASGSGASDGGINIIASGGTGNLNFVLNTGITQTSGIFASLTVGTYQVTITDANNCGPVSSNSLIVESPTSINNLDGTRIRLYPNPVSERVFVEVKNQEFKELKVELKNISGHASLTQKYENVGDGFVADIDLNRLPKGIYVIVVNNNVTKDKLIVQ